MLILLPDFIGHPSCFRGLLARLGATDCRPVDYHRLDAYASIEALASQVLDGLAEEPDWLIGYSFGGLVGYEMARQLPASRLLMIDSHLPWPALRRMPPSEQYQRWLSAEMREWIALMSELGELREEVLLRNVELFGRWQPPSPRPRQLGALPGRRRPRPGRRTLVRPDRAARHLPLRASAPPGPAGPGGDRFHRPHRQQGVRPMKHYRQVVSPQLRQQALDWILAAAQRPDPALEPEFDIADDERREAKKVRNLHRHDPLFWDDWFARSGLDALVRDHLRKPRLLRHAAFIKRHADESYIPLHQDIALWEKRYESAQTFWVALTPSRNDNGGMFYYPDDRTIFPHEFDLAYPMFKCIDLQANGISREQLVDAELDAGDVLVWPARTAHGSHNNRSGQLRIGMPIVFVDDDEFHQLNREDSMKTWIASNLKSVFPDEAITEDNLDHYLPQLCDYSLKMVTFLARFSRQFGHAPKIHDFIREPRLATLSASDAGARR